MEVNGQTHVRIAPGVLFRCYFLLPECSYAVTLRPERTKPTRFEEVVWHPCVRTTSEARDVAGGLSTSV